MKIPFAQIDAFASAPFEGNQACVMPLEAYLEDAVLQAIAAENNVAETAFIVPAGEDTWQLRWFTPAVEVPLCGHATLAAAHFLLARGEVGGARITFETRKSGALYVERQAEGLLEMDFPAPTIEETPVTDEMIAALGAAPIQAFSGPFCATVFDTAADIQALAPDLSLLKELGEAGEWDRGNVGCLAFDGDRGIDITSRFFAPGSGIDEDPATGSWHCMVAAIAAARFDRAVSCFQAYPGRGAHLEALQFGDRVKLRGRAVSVIEGTFSLV